MEQFLQAFDRVQSPHLACMRLLDHGGAASLWTKP